LVKYGHNLNAARHGYSYRSCDELGDLLKNRFPDSKIAEHYKIERTKLSHIIWHGLGPFFHCDLVQVIKKCEEHVLCFDGQKNHQNSKQLDLLLTYWSIQKQDAFSFFFL